MLRFSGWGGRLDDLKRRVGEIPPDAYWRAPQPRVKSAFLCLDALYPVDDWSEAAADAPLIVDALYKVQRIYLNLRKSAGTSPRAWLPPRIARERKSAGGGN